MCLTKEPTGENTVHFRKKFNENSIKAYFRAQFSWSGTCGRSQTPFSKMIFLLFLLLV